MIWHSRDTIVSSRSPKVLARSSRSDRTKASPRRHLATAPGQQSPRKQLQFDAGPAPALAEAGASLQKNIDPHLHHASMGMRWSAACEGMWTPLQHGQSEIPSVSADDATQVHAAEDTNVSPNDRQKSEKPRDGGSSPISRLEASMASFGSAIAANLSVTEHSECRPG